MKKEKTCIYIVNHISTEFNLKDYSKNYICQNCEVVAVCKLKYLYWHVIEIVFTGYSRSKTFSLLAFL